MQTILPVIVIYRIRLSQAASYTSLIRAAGISRFVVYDNSPADFEQEDITALCPEALYVRDTANSGLPRAYNLAARKAEEWGYTRVLLLDQDTTFPPEAWHCYQHAAGYTGVTAPLAVTAQGQTFSPYDPSVRRRTPAGLSAGEYSLHRFYVINSGMCVPVALFKQTGGYNERITLDFADFQFLMHVRRHSPRFLLLPFSIEQDFSNDVRDASRLLTRFAIYLRCAAACETEGWQHLLAHHYYVLRHTLALTAKCRSTRFLHLYLRFLLKGNPQPSTAPQA